MMEFAWEHWGRFGGRLALDFVNTIEDEEKTRARSGTPDWETALRWGVWADALDAAEAKALTSAAGAEAAFGRLEAFKESAWRSLSAIAAGGEADAADFAAISEATQWARAAATLRREGESFAWRVDAAALGAEVLRARLALDLDGLLCSGELARLRECGRCTGLYLDHGRGAGRRWCRMRTCGNRAKVERFRGKAAQR